MLAARSGDNTELASHISAGAQLDKTSKYGWTALMFAAWQGHKDAVEELLHAGADPNIVSDTISSGFMATSGGHPPTTALREAIRGRHVDIAFTLLDGGANVDPVAFSLAGHIGNIPLMERVLELGANINEVSDNQFYRSPLCEAASAGELKAVQWLINHGADPNLIAIRETALSKAVASDQVEVVDYLLNNGANPNLVLGSMRNTALYVAVTKYTYASKYDRNLAVIELLLSHGADRSHTAYEGRTALEFAESQRTNSLKYVQADNTPEVRGRHEAALRHMDAVIALLRE